MTPHALRLVVESGTEDPQGSVSPDVREPVEVPTKIRQTFHTLLEQVIDLGAKLVGGQRDAALTSIADVTTVLYDLEAHIEAWKAASR